MHPDPKRWMVLLTVSAGLLLITLDNSILYTALPTLTHELGATGKQGLWIINAYPLVMAGLLLGAGTLGDRIGHSRMFNIGLVLFGLSSILAAYSPSAPILIGARACLAVGAAAMMPATLALIRVTFTEERERNLAIAIWGSLSVVGAALGPIVGGLLLAKFWWGSVFLINVPVVVLALIGSALYAPSNRTDASRPWDLWSSVLALVVLSGLVVCIKEVATGTNHLELVIGAAVAALICAVLFVRRQAALPYPLLDFGLFRHPAFMSGVLAAGFATFTIGGLQLVTTQRFQLVANYTPLEAGLLVAAVAVGCLPTAMIGGAYLHRIGLRILIGGGLIVAALGSASIALLLPAGVGWVVAGCLVTGAGLGAVMSVASSAIIGTAPVHRAGMASSVEEVSYEFGSLTAVALLGSLLPNLYAAFLQLPAGAPEEARQSLMNAIDLARTAVDGDQLLHAANLAFDRAYVLVVLVVAGMLALGSIITWRILRGFDGPASSNLSH